MVHYCLWRYSRGHGPLIGGTHRNSNTSWVIWTLCTVKQPDRLKYIGSRGSVFGLSQTNTKLLFVKTCSFKRKKTPSFIPLYVVGFVTFGVLFCKRSLVRLSSQLACFDVTYHRWYDLRWVSSICKPSSSCSKCAKMSRVPLFKLMSERLQN